MTNPFNPYNEQIRQGKHRDTIESLLRNLQLLTIVNFIALLWILYRVGSR